MCYMPTVIVRGKVLYLISLVPSAPQLRCSVMLQKESVDGPKDEPCGKDAVGGCAGLCRYI